MTILGAAIKAEGLKDFSKSVGKATVNIGKKFLFNPTGVLEIEKRRATATKNTLATLAASTELNKIARTGQLKTLEQL